MNRKEYIKPAIKTLVISEQLLDDATFPISGNASGGGDAKENTFGGDNYNEPDNGSDASSVWD